MPLVNMWCAQTMPDSATMPRNAPVTHLYAYSGLRDMCARISSAMPKPGSTITYTAGCE